MQQKAAKSKGKPRGKPFQKGVSGNPGGKKPEELTFSAWTKAKLGEPDPDTGKTRQDELFNALYKAGKSGNVSAIEAIHTRAHGKPAETLKIDDARQEAPPEWGAVLSRFATTTTTTATSESVQ
jgi:hypothetical protein